MQIDQIISLSDICAVHENETEFEVELCSEPNDIKSINEFYFTDIYASADYIKSFDPDIVLNKNLMITKTNPHTFKSTVKSFLLKLLDNGTRIYHKTVTGKECVDVHFDKDKNKYDELITTVELLIVILGNDPRHSMNGEILKYIIEQRNFHERNTWIYSRLPIHSDGFKELYPGLTSLLTKSYFKHCKITNKSGSLYFILDPKAGR